MAPPTLPPAAAVLLHAKWKGIQAGSAAGILLALPGSCAMGEPLSVGGMACFAGSGMIIGATLTGISGTIKLATLDKAEIIDRAERLAHNAEQVRMDRLCKASLAIGSTFGVRRVLSISRTEDKFFWNTMLSKRGIWTVYVYGALGVGACVLTVMAVKGAAAALRKIDARRNAKKNIHIPGPASANVTAAAAVAEDKGNTETATEGSLADAEDRIADAVDTVVDTAAAESNEKKTE